MGLFARCRRNMIIFDKCGMTKFFIIMKEKAAYMEKMDKAMKIARLARIAGIAMGEEGKDGEI